MIMMNIKNDEKVINTTHHDNSIDDQLISSQEQVETQLDMSKQPISNAKSKKTLTKPNQKYLKEATKRRERQKQRKLVRANSNKKYSFIEALTVLVSLTKLSNFSETVTLHINTSINASKSDQNINSYIDLPHRLNLKRRILIVDQKQYAVDNSESNVVSIELEEIQKTIKSKKFNFYKIITSLQSMPKILPYARLLGPKGLLPSHKAGTIGINLLDLARKIANHRVFIQNDKGGVIHAPLGKSSLDINSLQENANTLVKQIMTLCPTKILPGNFVKSMYLATTHSPAIQIKRESFI